MNLFPSGFSFTSTITLACLSNDYTVKYVPINYYHRKGNSTINPIKDFIGFTTLIFKVIMYFKPLRFFLLPSLFLLFTGFLFSIYQIIAFKDIADLSIILILSGLQIGFIGFIADLIVRSRRK